MNVSASLWNLEPLDDTWLYLTAHGPVPCFIPRSSDAMLGGLQAGTSNVLCGLKAALGCSRGTNCWRGCCELEEGLPRSQSPFSIEPQGSMDRSSNNSLMAVSTWLAVMLTAFAWAI